MPTTTPLSAQVFTHHLSVLEQEADKRPTAAMVLDQLEASRDGWGRTQQLSLWTAQLCAGIAIGLFPYTPGLVHNCKPSNNPGWLCGANVATFVAASGASFIGIMAGTSFVRQRGWLQAHVKQVAMTLGSGSQASPSSLEAFLVDYLQLSEQDRQEVRRRCRQEHCPA